MAKGGEARVAIMPTQGEGVIAAIFKLPFKASGTFWYGMDFKGKSLDVGARQGTYTQTDSATVLDFGDFDLPGSLQKAPIMASLWGYDGAPKFEGRGEVYMNKKLWFKCKWVAKKKSGA